VWAVGSEQTTSFLMARWQGFGWTTEDVESPDGFDDSSAQLSDVVAVSPADAWAVGSYAGSTSDDNPRRTFALTLRWDGASWHPVPVPDPLR
ncbi:MAG: hypothetical protein M3P01_08920, partial [Actinomycetota bacterium]|nr:hypothetical protein [Actinomycetota bacterium]